MILAVLVRASLRWEPIGGTEIITGVERRRRWRLEEKLRIVAEAEQLGASFAAVARRHEVSRGLLWTWRRQVRAGVLASEPMPMFLPVQMVPDTRLLDGRSGAPKGAPADSGRIEIALPDGTYIRVGANVGLPALRRVMMAVRR